MKTFLNILYCSLCVVQISFPQWTSDSTVNTKVCNAQNDQKYPQMVSDGNGGTIIVWEDNRDSDTKIYAQRLDSAGVAKWTNNGILICSATGSKQPQITSDGAGGAIITWFDMRYGWPNSTVSVQRINANGDTLWQKNGIPVAQQANSWSYPVITGYGINGAVVAWIGIDGEIYAQKIDIYGTIKWNEGGVLIDSSGGEPQIVVDDAGGAIITWFDYDHTQPITSTNIFAQRVNVDGQILWTVSDTICNAPYYQQHPCLTADGNGGAIISWIDSRTQNDTAYIYAQKVSATGVAAWDINGIRISDIKSYFRSYITADNEGGAIITWLGTGYNGEVHVQRINGDGTREWPVDVRLTFGTNPSIPKIIEDGFGGAFVSWTTPNQLHLQHLNPEGIASFGVEGKIVSIGHGEDFQSMCTDGNGSVMFSWQDMRSIYTTDIYAHKITVPGLVTEVSDNKMIDIPSEFSISQNYPNPLNPSTIIRYSIPKSSQVSLKIFNALGEEIETLINEEKSVGTYELNWNAANLPSGVYFYRLQAGSFIQTRKMILLK
jgi:hypothetical protein